VKASRAVVKNQIQRFERAVCVDQSGGVGRRQADGGPLSVGYQISTAVPVTRTTAKEEPATELGRSKHHDNTAQQRHTTVQRDAQSAK